MKRSLLGGLLCVLMFGASVGLATSSSRAQVSDIGPVVISEFLAANRSGMTDQDSDTSDWIELHNPTPSAVSLAGWSLVDSNSAWNLPSVTLAPGGYLVVFASGKDRTAGELHTDFRLSAAGEALALRNAASSVVSGFLPSYPPQATDTSYGTSGADRGYMTPSPGSANGPINAGQAAAPLAETGSTISSTAMVERLVSTTPNATIHYTLDGTEPTTSSAVAGPGGVSISSASPVTRLRAFAVAPGFAPSSVVEFVYISPSATAHDLQAGAEIVAAVADRPAMVLTTHERLNASNYNAVTLSYIDDGDLGFFTEEMGAKFFGNWSLRSDKKNYRVNMSTEFGNGEFTFDLFGDSQLGDLDPATTFDKLEIRGFSGDGFAHENGRGKYVTNEFVRGLILRLGTPSSHHKYVNLFVDGEYRGPYELREKIDGDWLAEYFGGSGDDYETVFADLKWGPSFEVQDGTGAIWRQVRYGSYQSVKDLIDPHSLINASLALSFGGGGEKEWRMVAPIDPADRDGMVFIPNDMDLGIGFATRSTGPHDMLTRFFRDEEFKAIMWEQTAYAFCDDGPMTLPNVLDHLDGLVDEIAPMVAADPIIFGKGSVAKWQQNMVDLREKIITEHPKMIDLWTDAGWFTGCGPRPALSLEPNMVDVSGVSVELATADTVDNVEAGTTFSATGLPPGLTIDATTGTITGTPSQPGEYSTQVTATAAGGEESTESSEWTILESQSGLNDTSSLPVVLNEYNAVDDDAGTWLGNDVRFGQVADNGGDWFELLVVTDGLDLRGWTVELWDRDRDSRELVRTDAFTFADHAALASLSAGTVIAIAEDVDEDANYDPAAGDWLIVANASNLRAGSLIEPASRTNFDTTRRGFRILIRDADGSAVTPFIGETEQWRSAGQGGESNVGADEIMALCAVPSAASPIDLLSNYRASAVYSTFGQPNRCDDGRQSLNSLRGLRMGDANLDGDIDHEDVTAALRELLVPGGLSDATLVDLDTDGFIALSDAQSLAQCVAAGRDGCEESGE